MSHAPTEFPLSDVVAALLPLLVLSSLQGVPLGSIHDAALEWIAQAHSSVEVDSGPVSEQLTPVEMRQLGRYFETPLLEEIHPGIGMALQRRD